MLAGLVLLAGCGSLDINLNTSYQPSGDYTQKLIYTATGPIGEALAAAAGQLTGSQDGWQISVESDDQGTTLTASRSFGKDEVFAFPADSGDTPPQLSFERSNFIVFTNYRFQATIPAGSEWGMSGETDLVGLDVLNQIFNISWTVNMPGEIAESNADTVDGDAATWNLEFTDLNTGVTLTAESRLMNWAAIYGVSAVLAMALIAVILLLLRRRAQIT